MPVASEAVKHKRDKVMLTGIRKAKCPCCGHEFIAMEGGVVHFVEASRSVQVLHRVDGGQLLFVFQEAGGIFGRCPGRRGRRRARCRAWGVIVRAGENEDGGDGCYAEQSQHRKAVLFHGSIGFISLLYGA